MRLKYHLKIIQRKWWCFYEIQFCYLHIGRAWIISSKLQHLWRDRGMILVISDHHLISRYSSHLKIERRHQY